MALFRPLPIVKASSVLRFDSVTALHMLHWALESSGRMTTTANKRRMKPFRPPLTPPFQEGNLLVIPFFNPFIRIDSMVRSSSRLPHLLR